MKTKWSCLLRQLRILAICSIGAAVYATPINPVLPTTAAGTSFMERGMGTVSFTVTNSEPFPLILDYALAIIVQDPGSDADDLVRFTGETAPTQILNPGSATYTYFISNPAGMIEPEDDGKDEVYFWAEFSNANNCTTNPTTRITTGLGIFVFPGPACTDGPYDSAVLNTLENCVNSPTPTLMICAPTGQLYPNSFDTVPFPADATVSVSDGGGGLAPEPSTLLLCLGAIPVAGTLWRRMRARNGNQTPCARTVHHNGRRALLRALAAFLEGS